MDKMSQHDIVTSIEDIPEEVLLEIFRFCPLEDLALSFQHVCTKWHNIMQLPSPWKGRFLNINWSNNSKKFKTTLINAPLLYGLSLNGHNIPENVPSLLKDYCQHLKCLHVKAHNFPLNWMSFLQRLQCFHFISLAKNLLLDSLNPSNSLRVLHIVMEQPQCNFKLSKNIFKQYPLLEELLIARHIIKEDYLGHFSNMTNSMRSIYIEQIQSLSDDMVHSTGNFCDLNNLTLTFNSFKECKWLEIFFHKQYTKLKILDLGYSLFLSTRVITAICNYCVFLENFSLARCAVYDQDFLVILNNLPNLRRLNLHGTKITSAHFPIIPTQLKNLQDLNVCVCRRVNRKSVFILTEQMPYLLVIYGRSFRAFGKYAENRESPFAIVRNSL